MVKVIAKIDKLTDETFLIVVSVAKRTIFYDFVTKYETSKQFSMTQIELFHANESESKTTLYADKIIW